MEDYYFEIIREKQKLLEEEIINKNHEKDEFINFCISNKDNGDDSNS